ncbi:hypothetical protein LAJLEIBI_03028 [[Clostridium] hylemonae DSM 15053]|uniref:hypothetical protein n=1 Tax=[Clostridium] hylemonae TaxID=89153 RepID=UPI00125AECBE|nr:hypothetical protein [[Clostridium] hylemonae]QEK18997.1 hypothetical protein LAJLEIBI_03028 [[Clostridium] hylemonae DSM 15053]
MVIDTHAHVFFLDKFIDYDDKPLFQYMEEQKVDRCSCIATTKAENAAMLESVGKYGDKLFGIGYVNVHDMENSLKELRIMSGKVLSGVSRCIHMLKIMLWMTRCWIRCMRHASNWTFRCCFTMES